MILEQNSYCNFETF